ncbi:Polysaccharide biosynthesis protein [Methanocaldococcus lauensis]|uniref:Polysaccharide biosynthesis protein n=1 Tax=Methanocaldococcus lauensis TaxID=2546128 RepID=A0A8D6SXA1_9EURY|nr:flippase [Methanocaldococcus lauensis]CAB3290130.1 Polysaccharide biosynthesis protein [Methanocaldococcus lauensis]
MEYKEKVIKGVSWHLLSYLIATPLAYLVRVLYANELPKLDVGLFYAVWDFFNMLVVFRAFGLDQALVRYIPKYLTENRLDMLKSSVVFVGILQTILAFIVAFLVITLAPYIATYYINNKGQFTGNLELVINVLVIMAIGYYFLQSIADFFSYLFSGFQYQNYASSTRVVKILVVFIFSLIFIYLFNIHNAYVPSLSYALTPIVMILIYGFIVYKKIFPKFLKEKIIFSMKLIKDMFSYGMYVMMSSAGGLILGYLDGMCLTYFTGLTAVADYRNVAMPTVSILSYFAFSIGAVLFPMSSELWEKGYKKVLCYGIEKVYLYSLVIVTPLSILMAYFPTVIINILFNQQYLSASPAIQILSFGAIFSTFNSIGFSILNGIGKPNLSTKILYIGATFNLIFNVLLIPKLGIIGASITTALGYFIMWIFQIWCLNKLLKYQFLNKKWIIVILVGMISLIPIVFIKDLIHNTILQLIVCGIVYFGIYILGIFRLNIIQINEIKDIIDKIIRR